MYTSAVIGSPSARAFSTIAINSIQFLPILLPGRLQVVDLGTNARLAGDGQQLLHGFDELRAFAAQVGDVQAVIFGGRFRQRDQFVGLGEEARRIDQARTPRRSRLPSSPAAPSPASSGALPRVGARSSWPITWIRGVAAPMNDATLQDTPRRSRSRRYSSRVVHSISYLMSPWLFDHVLLHPAR